MRPAGLLDLSAEDATKLDAVRTALRQGDIAAAVKYGRVFELVPLAGQEGAC